MPFIAAPVADLLDSVAVQSGQRQLKGKGSNVCNRGGSKRVPLQRSSQGSLSSMALAEVGLYGGARKDKIELLCLWGEQLHTFTAILSVHFVHSGLRKHKFSLAKP